MILGKRLEGEIVVDQESFYGTRRYYEARLVSEEREELLHLFEGQLKEVQDELQAGARYRIVFTPFLNNRWVELKITELTQLD